MPLKGLVNRFSYGLGILARNKAKRVGKKPPEQCEFTGHIICPKCNKAYRNVTSNGSTGWNCTTYISEGKAKCQGKKIPDTILRAVITELLGLREYSAEAFTELIDTIYPYEGNRLVFAFKDGTVREATWKDRSRAESWTPEMKEKAKAREYARRRSP